MEEMGLVAGGVAHEFNNLLTVINGFAAILVRKGGDDRNVLRYASSILNAGLRGAKITADLLAYSGNQILHPRVVDLNEFLESMKARVHGAIRANITIEMDLSDRSNRIHVDPDLLEQMVVVLVRNASDAMRHGGCIRIHTAVTEMNAEILEKATSEVAPGRYVVL
jgi:two-component system, cell cycle sensor histidine kinase and response regulator CckA